MGDGRKVHEQIFSALVRRDKSETSRFGGDEFVTLIGDLSDTRIAKILAHNLVENLSQPYMLHGHKFDISVSIGISIYPTDREEPETLLMNADKAMYQTKRRGGNACQFYDAAMSSILCCPGLTRDSPR